MEETDYITVVATLNPRKFLAVVMRWHARDEEFVQARVSQPLSRTAAESLAQMWAAAMKLEIR